MSWVTAPVLVGLSVSVATMAASTFATLGTSALAPYLRTSLHLSTFEVGLIPGLVFLGALSASVPAGQMTDRIGAGRALTLSQLGVACGVAVAALAFGRFNFLAGIAIAGVGYGAVNPATNVLSTGLVPRRRRALFLSVKQMGVTLGGLMAGLALPRIAQALGWRAALLAAVGVLLAGAITGRWITSRERAGWFGPAGHQASRSRPAAVHVSVPGAGPTAVFGFVMSGVQLSLAGYLTLYLVEAHGFAKTTAGAALSVAFAAACVGRIAWGWLSDRCFTSHATTLVLISGASTVALAVLASGVTGASLWLIVVMIGLFSLGWNGVYMALITDSAGPRGLGRATGRGLTAIYSGVAVVPPLLGVIKDVTHSWSAVWAVSIGGVLLATATLAISPRRLVRVDAEEPGLLGTQTDAAA
jgi:MFS family permease